MSIENGWKNEDPRVILSLAVGFAAAVFLTICFSARAKKLAAQKELAIEKGHIIHAKRVSLRGHRDTSDSKTRYHGIYEYTVSGETKRYSLHADHGLPQAYLTLYYANTPDKVFSDYDHPQRFGCSMAGLLGIAAGLLTLFLTGYISL